MAKAIKTNNYAKNILDRNFERLGPRMALLTDITYIPFKGIHIYFSPVIDACTKQTLAYKYSTLLEVEFVIDMLKSLKENHGDELTSKTIIHSDQVCHYTSNAFFEEVKQMELLRSMSRRGNCWDNSPQESYFGHMKDEINEKIENCETVEEVYKVLDDWVAYYNSDRPIWGLNKMTPDEYFEHLKNGGTQIIKKKTKNS